MDGSRSISSERRNASERPSSSSIKTPSRESSNSAANLARSDSGSLNANDSTSVRVTMTQIVKWIGRRIKQTVIISRFPLQMLSHKSTTNTTRGKSRRNRRYEPQMNRIDADKKGEMPGIADEISGEVCRPRTTHGRVSYIWKFLSRNVLLAAQNPHHNQGIFDDAKIETTPPIGQPAKTRTHFVTGRTTQTFRRMAKQFFGEITRKPLCRNRTPFLVRDVIVNTAKIRLSGCC